MEKTEVVSIPLESLSGREPELENHDSNGVTKSVATCIAYQPGVNTSSLSYSGSHSVLELFDSEMPFVNILNSVEATDCKGIMPVTYSYIGSRKVSVPRDSGCNTTIVKADLIDECH